MRLSRPPAFVAIVLAASIAGTACGSDGSDANADVDVATTDTPADTIAATGTEPETSTPDPDDEDHDDEDHDDEDHNSEDHDDEDHDDEDHDDEDHDNEDHDEDHDNESGGFGAHEHGTAELSVAWIGDDVAIDLVSPNFNVFGFEYEPTSDEDIATEADRTAAITGDGIITINDDAGCALDGPASTEVERDGSHSEITVSWSFTCDNADAISEVDASGLFAEFPDFEDVDVQWISDTQQSSAELSPSTVAFTLQR